MGRLPLVFLLLALAFQGLGQIAPDKYLVEFTDKSGSPYSVDQPGVYLSQRAIDRRARYGIAVTEQDFPVNPAYIEAVRATGVKYIQQSRWFNSIVIKTTDTIALQEISQLPFVKKVTKRPSVNPEGTSEPTGNFFKEQTFPMIPGENLGDAAYDYGEGFAQISMVGGTVLHDRGYRGQGIGIAILDGGFTGTNQMAVFDSLNADQRILGTLNFVGGGTYVYQGTPHGSAVLSVMAADIPGFMIGTAPKADYWLIRTEDVNTEYLLEEYNWVSGAEYADSAGADIISNSLAYTTFIDPVTSHTYSQTDGNTAPITIGADIACSKGMIVVTSAGNSGQDWTWPHIGFPADGDSVMTIGAVDAHGIYAPFSSTGPTADGRLKPDAAARGIGTIVAEPGGSLVAANGTSYSTPIIAGMIACLWQAFPEKTNMKILDAVKKSCSHDLAPDTLTGHGVPDFSKAFDVLLGIYSPKGASDPISVSPNPFATSFSVSLPQDARGKITATITDLSGKIILRRETARSSENKITVTGGLESLRSGLYFLRITTDNDVYLTKIIKL